MAGEPDPAPGATSTTSMAVTRDGLAQLRRHWPARRPVRAALLLVHGLGEHSGRYEHVGSFLAERGIDVLGFDNRGFGHSGGRRGHVDRFEDYLDDVEDLLAERRRLSLPVVLFGHSLGGLIVARYLVEHRCRPDLAVLSSPALAAGLPWWKRLAAPILGRIAPWLQLPSPVEGALLSRDPVVGERYATDPLVVRGATAGLSRVLFEAMAVTVRGLDRITVPTYVVHGQDDSLVPASTSEVLEALPDVTRRCYQDLLHECFNEPERQVVLDDLAYWLDEQLDALD
jgi:alpha-beta hydrolase superfamily lysophospholipase